MMYCDINHTSQHGNKSCLHVGHANDIACIFRTCCQAKADKPLCHIVRINTIEDNQLLNVIKSKYKRVFNCYKSRIWIRINLLSINIWFTVKPAICNHWWDWAQVFPLGMWPDWTGHGMRKLFSKYQTKDYHSTTMYMYMYMKYTFVMIQKWCDAKFADHIPLLQSVLVSICM